MGPRAIVSTADSLKKCPGNREVAPGNDGNSIKGLNPATPSWTVLQILHTAWANALHSVGASSMSLPPNDSNSVARS
jgi:hypothetical protein